MRARFDAYARQTADFTVPLETLDDKQITAISYVGPYFLRGLPKLLEILHPKHRPVVRRAIPYLEALREMQDEAMERLIQHTIKENDRHIAAIDRCLKKHGYK